MEYIIREMYPQEYPLLAEFLYESIFQREGEELLPRTIISQPDLQVYIQDFGTLKDDACLCAEADGLVIGAVWVRNIHGYGDLDDETPEFAISLFKEYRGCGIGTELMKQMLELLRKKGYKRASLSVQKDNYALHMYQKVGFKPVIDKDEEFIMEYRF